MTKAFSFRTGIFGIALISLSLLPPSVGAAQEGDDDPCELPRVDGSEAAEEQEPIGERLERCGGVLEPPPAVGDQDLLAPAPDPDPGTTPIIPPGDVPIQ